MIPTSESDEYVEIKNTGSGSADMLGWLLTDIADGTPAFQFPAVTIDPGESIRVYTNEVHPESGGFSFGRGTSIWNNSSPDEAALYNASGEVVSRKSYPPGCQTPS
ncbi:MAG: lamin tail domain-containing protein [Dehalococcoidia bacterium]|nr:lamin tail domain-containing protein [Dehalococcoidia bacterium]